MNTLESIYTWGVIVALVFQFYGITMYMFGTSERLQYQRNLNRAGLSWDPMYFKIYNASDFKHTVLRYWAHMAWGFFECLFSWLSVCGRVYRIMKLREIAAMLTPEQKQALFVLRSTDLPKEEVFQKLKIVDPEIREPGDIRLIGVDSKEFSKVFAKTLVDEKARQIVVPLLEASGLTVSKREMAFLQYAVGDDPDKEEIMRILDEYRNSDLTDTEIEILHKQLEALKAVFGTEGKE